MVFKRSKTDIFRFLPEMRGRSKNLRRLSSSTYSVFPKSFLDRTFISRGDCYRCFSDNFRLHDTILSRPMTQFTSLAITSKRKTLHPLAPNFRTKLFFLKNPCLPFFNFQKFITFFASECQRV